MESKKKPMNRSTYQRRKHNSIYKISEINIYGHVNRMEDNKNVKATVKWNPTDRRSRGRPKTRWKDDVEADLRAVITSWKTSTEDKLAWKKIVEQAKTHPGLQS
jgi:hypothetical protein